MKASLAKAQSAWGNPMPDWIQALCDECDNASLRKIAARLAVSPATLSLAINKQREPGSFAFLKAKVEAKLMISIVPCPVLGILPKAECLQEQARDFSGANPLRAQLYRACRNGCEHYRGKSQ